ncbi:glycosyltransferase [Trinickia sp. EG282A]|uniref:glycosyltransferase n=1 Tax=Trinickia sp. EG282A TaxID=3237013 RepID=UPI0034D2A508
MATVSILIPARRADYLGRALISAQRQTFDDVEILVGDETPDAALQPIVERLDDARISYFHHGPGDALRNEEALWARASGRYVKWLGDSDMLMPESVERLVDAFRRAPASVLAFHGRVFVDANDSVVDTPRSLMKVNELGLVGRDLLVREMVGELRNFIGETSNVMVDRERASADDVFAYRGFKLDGLGDVGMYLNLAERAPLIAVGGYWSMSRRDASERARRLQTYESAAIYEWELFVRGEAASGRLTGAALAEAAARLQRVYSARKGDFPELARLLDNLGELTTIAAPELFDTERFRSGYASARAAVAARTSQAALGASPNGHAAATAAPRHADSPTAVTAKPVRLVCATRVSQERFMTDTALGRSLSAHRYEQAPELLLYANNSTGLPTLYNAAIEQSASHPAILVFVHDDVSIVDFFWAERVQEALRHFDVVGLAGNRRRLPRQPAWAFGTPDFKWDDAAFLSGSVGHGNGFPSQVSRFGPAGVECKLLDGLMLIADSERLVQAGVRFDEQFAFHFYDVDFCRQAESKGLRMGTWPISVVHESGGAFGSATWRAGYERYLRKYGE